MGKKSQPAAPAPADPTKTIAAQTASNEATARLQQQLGMTGTYGPGGSVTYRADPNSPSGYSQYTELDPSQRAVYDKTNTAQIGALDTANAQIGRINTALGQSLTPPEMQTSFGPGARVQTRFNTGPNLQFGFDQGGAVQTSFDQGGPLQNSFDTGQAVQGQVGPSDFSAERNAVIDNEFSRARSRLDPMWNQAQDKERVRLSNQGLSQNSTAYQNAQGNFDRARNDAYDTALSSAVRSGGAEQDRLFNERVAQGQFANSAAGQQYAQNMGAAQFGNDTAMSNYGRNMGAATFANDATGQQYDRNFNAANFRNTAAGQQFGQNQSAAGFNNAAGAQQYSQNMGMANFGNAARQQNFQNLAYSQNLPIEQFATLMGTGGSVQMPSAYSGPVAGVNGTDVAGVYAANDAARNQQYQINMQNRASTNQALGGLAGAVLGNWQNIF